MDKEKILKVLTMISEDAKKDVKEAEGQLFNGRNVSVFNGKQNAMIGALADILKEVFKDATT